MKRRILAALATSCLVLSAIAPTVLRAQTFPTQDPVLRRIWTVGMDSSRVYPLAQTLMDSIGPRLTGTPQQTAAIDWAIARLGEWGVNAKKVQYGTWKGWSRGTAHIDMISPRVRTLDATLLAWSPGTGGKDVEGSVIPMPTTLQSLADFEAWLPQVKGKFVMTSFAQPTCRPDDDWRQWSASGTFERMDSARAREIAAHASMLKNITVDPKALPGRLEAAGAAGLVTNMWSRGWGVDKIFNGRTERIPTMHVSCEDYGLLFRLATNNQSPQIRVNAHGDLRGEVPVYNVIGEIKGSEKPDEYIVLSAHYDSWDGGTGATDNGTGSVTMLEALRILKTVYPNPKRSIIIALWSGEEQGLVGSRSFVADRPEVVKGLQVLLNQDNGTGRITSISGQGLTEVGSYLARWISRLPDQMASEIKLGLPGGPPTGGTDHAAFVCSGAPGINLSSLTWSYGTYTWHTNRDTFDKLSMEDVRGNAVLTAMLAYLASEEPTMVPRDRRATESGWPQCAQAPRNSGAWTR